MSDKLWNLGTAAAAAFGASVANKASKKVWEKTAGGTPSADPEDPAANWGKALMFAAFSGALVQLVRLVINRQATRTYIRATGHRPTAK